MTTTTSPVLWEGRVPAPGVTVLAIPGTPMAEPSLYPLIAQVSTAGEHVVIVTRSSIESRILARRLPRQGADMTHTTIVDFSHDPIADQIADTKVTPSLILLINQFPPLEGEPVTDAAVMFTSELAELATTHTCAVVMCVSPSDGGSADADVACRSGEVAALADSVLVYIVEDTVKPLVRQLKNRGGDCFEDLRLPELA